MNRQQHMLMKILQKIRIFAGLEVSEAQTLLSSSFMKQFPSGEIVYEKGDPSDDMLVLILGRLKVVGEDGHGLVDIPPGTSIGEMGLFTGQPRSARIVAADKSAGLVFSKEKLDALMAAESHLKSIILQNMMELMSERLIDADQRLEEYRQKIIELGGEV